MRSAQQLQRSPVKIFDHLFFGSGNMNRIVFIRPAGAESFFDPGTEQPVFRQIYPPEKFDGISPAIIIFGISLERIFEPGIDRSGLPKPDKRPE